MEIPSFLSPRCVTHEVNGEAQHFYPISVRRIFDLRVLSTRVAQSLQTLFFTNQDDVGKEQNKIVEGGADGAYQERFVASPIDPELAKERYQQKQKAISDLIDCLLSEESGFILVKLVMDSMRDVDWPKKPSQTDLANFVDNCSAEILMEMVQGVIAANKKLFAPLAKWVDQAKDTVKTAMRKDRPAATSDQPVNEPSKETAATGPSLSMP